MNIAKYNALHVSDIVKYMYIILQKMSFFNSVNATYEQLPLPKSLKKDVQIRLK